MISLGNVNFDTILSVLIIAFLLFMIGHHLFRKLSLEGFENEEPANMEDQGSKQVEDQVEEDPVPKVEDEGSKQVEDQVSNKEPVPNVDSALETDKSTMMTDLFESVNKQMDMIRTLKLSETMVPIKIDKSVPDSQIILANLKLLINNGVYKNELDLKEVYDKYIGNKAVLLLASDINSLKLESADSATETVFLTRTKSVVDGHQKILDKIFDNKSKE
jgi:hypothetical protein